MSRKTKSLLVSLPPYRVRGRFRAIVHDGHTLDAEGNILQHGNVLRETPFGRNTITLDGFNALLDGSVWHMWCVVGDGNSTPNESDTILDNYLGKASSRPSFSVTVNSNPAALPLYWRLEARHQFAPGSLGVSSVNIAEAGITISATDSPSGVTGSTAVGARGLLQDEGGSPTTVAVEPSEYLDIVWEYTEYLPYDDSGTVSISIDEVPTDHTYTVRPANLVVGGGYGWQSPGAFNGLPTNQLRFPTIYTELGDSVWGRGTGMSNGVLGAPSTVPTSTYSGETRPQTATLASYVTNSKEREATCVWTLARGNAPAPGYSNVFTFHLGHTNWQMSLDPAIEKVATKQFNLTVRLAMENA